MGVTRGVIIGSSLKEGGVWWSPASKDRVARFMETVGTPGEDLE